MQTAHMRALVHLNQFSGQSSFFTWLTRIMINEGISRARSARRHQQLEEENFESGAAATPNSISLDPEERLFEVELNNHLQTALDQIPHRLSDESDGGTEHGRGCPLARNLGADCKMPSASCAKAPARPASNFPDDAAARLSGESSSTRLSILAVDRFRKPMPTQAVSTAWPDRTQPFLMSHPGNSLQQSRLFLQVLIKYQVGPRLPTDGHEARSRRKFGRLLHDGIHRNCD